MEERDNLTRDEARTRAATVSGPIRYRVTLDLTQGEKAFGSETVLRFGCAEPGASTFLDFIADSVQSAEINGSPLGPDAFDGKRLHLSGLEAENEVRVVARCRYSHTGSGIHRFVDPVDGLVYTYTDFEPFDAHRVFACFDQPDLKGVFEFVVIAPEAWEVASNMAEISREPSGEGAIRWTFAETPVVSTYITSVVAGAWHIVRGRHGNVDLGLFSRQSMAQYLEPDEVFEITGQGLDYFEKAFDYPYPFGKYDQAMVPEFNSGAMENAGLITFNEAFVFRSKVTDAARERRAETILHEMAHMWFGDLVTMRWWDDLWLNETFATYMSALAVTKATRFAGGWVTFANQEKTWAYQQDQLPSTHPITADMPDTESIHTNFDGITYAKGAAVMRQLVAWVGEEDFLRGIQIYFRRHEWGNTDLNDFLSAIEEASGRDLQAWAKEWLQTAGVNVLKAEYEASPEGAFTSFAITQQAPPEHPILRPHRLGVGLFGLGPDGLARRDRLELDVAGSRTEVLQLVGASVPDLVLVNDGDLAYARIRLDERSLQTVTWRLGQLREALARALCWGACWDMVRDGEMATRDLLALVLGNIGAEDEIGVVQRILAQLGTAIEAYGDPANREAARQSLADAAFEAMNGAAPRSDLQLAWARAFASEAASEEHLGFVRGLLDGTNEVEGLAIDTELRWHLVESLASGGAADEALIQAEAQRDPTDAGSRHAATALASRPTAEAKGDAWTKIVEDAAVTAAMLSAHMRGFQQPGQEDLLRSYAPRYFEALGPMWRDRSLEIGLNFARAMFPAWVIEQETVALTDRYLESGPVPGPVHRTVVEGRDALQRALRARARDIAARP